MDDPDGCPNSFWKGHSYDAEEPLFHLTEAVASDKDKLFFEELGCLIETACIKVIAVVVKEEDCRPTTVENKV